MESRWETGFRIPEVLICKWSIEILRVLACRAMKFSEIAAHLKINNKVLSDRLRKLASLQLIRKSECGQYAITRRGVMLVHNFSILFEHGLQPSAIEDVLRCKWMRSILEALYETDLYASEILNRISGIRWKILSERLKKLEGYGLVDREVAPTRPIRVRYKLTRKGRILAGWILVNEETLPVRL